MYTLIFDANVPWDLDLKVNTLDEIMRLMDTINFKIYISSINFYEMKYHTQINLRKHKHVIIDEPNQNEYDGFRTALRQKGIILNAPDSAVLYTSHKFDADYIVSSDTQVRLMSEKYANSYIKKVKPFHLMDMFSFLHGINMIESNSCIKMSLKLYEHKEIPQMIEEYGKELILNKQEQSKWIRNETKSSMDTFNSYERHIIEHLR
ncbi:MAG: hypothetical protein WA130_11325 [Candidatus Methanoperedens sp.]